MTDHGIGTDEEHLGDVEVFGGSPPPIKRYGNIFCVCVTFLDFPIGITRALYHTNIVWYDMEKWSNV